MGIMDHYIDIGATNQKGSKWEQYGKRATDIINKLNKDLTMAGTEGLIGAAANVITNAKNQVTPGMNKHAEKIASFGIGIKKAAQNAANMDSEVASKFRIDSIGSAKGIFENTVNIPRKNNQEIELIALSAAGTVKDRKAAKKAAKDKYLKRLEEELTGTRFSDTYETTITVDDSKRVRVGKVKDNFVTITDPNSSGTYYGGNQGWFANEPDYGKRLNENGCGAIAAVNLYLYLTGQTTITRAEYEKLVNGYMKAEDCSPDSRARKSKNRIKAVKGFTGAIPGQMTEYVEHMCRDKGVNVDSDWDCVQGYEDDYQNMKKQLDEGTPVIWAINDNNENAKRYGDKTKVGVMFYKYDASTGTYFAAENNRTVTSHYVTATAIYEDTDINGKTHRMVEVSSWGEKYYVDYDQYVDLVSDDPNNEPFSSITNTTVGN